MSDVPLGAMLSGGLDSSVIVALMSRHMRDPVKTFSVGFSGGTEPNELADARMVSDFLGTDHHELELSIDDHVDLETLTWYMDEPVADLSALGFFALSEIASQQVTVALSGQGADELLAGYRKHRAAALSGAFARSTFGAGPALARSVGRRTSRGGAALAALGARDPAERLLAGSAHLGGTTRHTLLTGPLSGSGGTAEAMVRELLGTVNGDALGAALYLDARLGLVDDMLHYFDRMSMAHSLEVRVPFLDHEFVELCATIPSREKLRAFSRTKHVLKVAARGLVPQQVIDKAKVGFFNRSAERWVQAQTDQAIATYLLDPGARTQAFVDRAALESLVRSHGHSSGTYAVLSLLMLEVWLSTYLTRAVSHPVRP
jgi:asparagine synthase (glutamine-hydrolysing)